MPRYSSTSLAGTVGYELTSIISLKHFPLLWINNRHLSTRPARRVDQDGLPPAAAVHQALQQTAAEHRGLPRTRGERLPGTLATQLPRGRGGGRHSSAPHYPRTQVMALWQNGKKYPAVVRRMEPDGSVSVQVSHRRQCSCSNLSLSSTTAS